MGRDEDEQEQDYELYGDMGSLVSSSSSEHPLVVAPVASDSDDSGTSSSSDDGGPPPLLHVASDSDDSGTSSSSDDERPPPHPQHVCDLDAWSAAANRDIIGFVDRNGSVVGPFMLTCGEAIRGSEPTRSISSDPLCWSRDTYLKWFLDNTYIHGPMAPNPALRRLEVAVKGLKRCDAPKGYKPTIREMRCQSRQRLGLMTCVDSAPEAAAQSQRDRVRITKLDPTAMWHGGLLTEHNHTDLRNPARVHSAMRPLISSQPGRVSQNRGGQCIQPNHVHDIGLDVSRNGTGTRRAAILQAIDTDFHAAPRTRYSCISGTHMVSALRLLVDGNLSNADVCYAHLPGGRQQWTLPHTTQREREYAARRAAAEAPPA
jgi:hypothetical protein